MTLTIELSEATYLALKSEADSGGTPVESAVVHILEDRFRTTATDEEFDRYMDEAFEEHDEVLRRLAK